MLESAKTHPFLASDLFAPCELNWIFGKKRSSLTFWLLTPDTVETFRFQLVQKDRMGGKLSRCVWLNLKKNKGSLNDLDGCVSDLEPPQPLSIGGPFCSEKTMWFWKGHEFGFAHQLSELLKKLGYWCLSSRGRKLPKLWWRDSNLTRPFKNKTTKT